MTRFEITIQDDIPYVVRGGQRLFGTLYAPIASVACPVLIAAHGGGWQRGNRQDYAHVGRYLAERGIAVFAISYRLAVKGVGAYPAAVHDVRSAVQYLRVNAEQLKLDSTRIGLMGDSAGAHLAALVALAGDRTPFASELEEAYPGVCCQAKVLVGIYGVYDLVAQWRHDQLVRPRDHITELFLNESLIDDRHLYHEASPLTYATTAAPRSSVFLVWGTADDVVAPESQSHVFFEALKQSGQFVRTLALAAAPHFWINEDPYELGSFTGFMLPKLMDFLKNRL